jgi:hypothetical protein
MARGALPAGLVIAAVTGDLSGRHSLVPACVLTAIPAAFAYALACYGDTLDARSGRLRPLLAGFAAVLLVVSAALRSPAVVGGVPQLAVTCAVLTIVLYGAIGLGALMPAPRTRASALQVDETPLVSRRRAA